ncbi:MAG TPA: DUF1015 domain-containing protein [Acidimicrobiales bacterium]|nr:DUF1015 domain-containing protein [Acidimicrobiales bacterium]
MPRFEPFPGIRYDNERVSLDDVVAPPYDVIAEDERRRLEARSPYNIVRVDLSRATDGGDRYEAAGCRFEEWLDQGVLVVEPEPVLYVYRMGFRDEAGRSRQTTGVIGALELAPTDGSVLPHERTMAKPKDDRLKLMRACRANVSPIWGLSLAQGLSDLCTVEGPPVARCTDDEGVHHRLWRVTRPAVIDAIRQTVASAPVVIADGHHRYETALAYRDERRAAAGDRPGDYDLVLAYVVELADEHVSVGPIHRLLWDLPDGFDPAEALASQFELGDGGAPGPDLPQRLADADASALVVPGHTWWLRPRANGDGDGVADEPDAARLDRALAAWPSHNTGYPHRAADVLAAVGAGQAQAGLLLRAATVDQIARTARAGRRMPEKTTFFRPKPRTGLVFRRLED